MASVLHDEAVFEDPLTFKPQRYLEGDIALKKQRTIPFSIGMETLPILLFCGFFIFKDIYKLCHSDNGMHRRISDSPTIES